MADASRRFPAPWRTEKAPGGFVVRDATGSTSSVRPSQHVAADSRPPFSLDLSFRRRAASVETDRTRGRSSWDGSSQLIWPIHFILEIIIDVHAGCSSRD
jgi:hypothetical protein